MMDFDGTWRRECAMMDVSGSGVLLTVNGSVAGLDLKEFFLLLSSTGFVYRRCELVRLNGEQTGHAFANRSAK
ncbi:PilZ domain-containing protein [Afipia massiliensis]|uniref:PilZ domain-containing protein n=1 Tax=Afipia massiliensis TaxID=211460 RepID=UPI001FEDD854|nr:PilZ domain-containing protein [Afipia massiliensis]